MAQQLAAAVSSCVSNASSEDERFAGLSCFRKDSSSQAKESQDSQTSSKDALERLILDTAASLGAGHAHDALLHFDHARPASATPSLSSSNSSRGSPYFIQSAPAAPGMPGLQDIKTLFEQSEREQLRLENQQLKKQAQLLARKLSELEKSQYAPEDACNPKTVKMLQKQVQSLKLDKEAALKRLQDTVAQNERLETDLRQLRAFLLGSLPQELVHLVPAPVPDRLREPSAQPSPETEVNDFLSEDDGESVDSADESDYEPESQYGRTERELTPLILDDGTIVYRGPTPAPVIETRRSKRKLTASVQDHPSKRQRVADTHAIRPTRPRRKVVMSDVQTELLLAASRRAQRLHGDIQMSNFEYPADPTTGPPLDQGEGVMRQSSGSMDELLAAAQKVKSPPSRTPSGLDVLADQAASAQDKQTQTDTGSDPALPPRPELSKQRGVFSLLFEQLPPLPAFDEPIEAGPSLMPEAMPETCNPTLPNLPMDFDDMHSNTEDETSPFTTGPTKPRIGRPPQMTLAQHLALGVTSSHPMVDPVDISKGMTPAAALAKRIRSPYSKWTDQEDELLVRAVAEHGTKWDAVQKQVPERSYHQCRQRWLKGLKCGDAIPGHLKHLKKQIDAAVSEHEASKAGRRTAIKQASEDI